MDIQPQAYDQSQPPGVQLSLVTIATSGGGLLNFLHPIKSIKEHLNIIE
jgi:hypothetical protein